MKKTTIVCIIPSLCAFRSLPNLKKCIENLNVSKKDTNVSLKIIIVTNGKKIFLNGIKRQIIKLIRVKGKFNYSIMNNLAYEFARKEYEFEWVLFINDDAFVEESFFYNFTELVKQKKFDLLNPLIYKTNSPKIDSYGIIYFRSGYAKNATKKNLKTSLATAGVLLVRQGFLNKVYRTYGYIFNADLVSYYEDVEFSVRSLGLKGKIIKSDKLVAYHYGSFSTVFKSTYMLKQSYRNIIWTIILTWPLKDIFHNFLAIVIVQFWFLVFTVYKFGPGFYLDIIFQTIKHLPKLVKDRKVILSSFYKGFGINRFQSNYIFMTGQGKRLSL